MLQTSSMRIGRLLFGLLAIWCLGCNSFEMLAGALKQSESMVACSDRSASSAMVHDDAPSVSAPASNQSSRVDQGCGCDHCVGTEIIVAQVTPPPRDVPESFNVIAQFPAKVTREPFVPPPEAHSAV